jgi:transcription elongation factor SPT5
VLHIHQYFFAFLHIREIPENGGVFVTRASRFTGRKKKSGETGYRSLVSEMNSRVAGGATTGDMAGSVMGRVPRDTVIGSQKGYLGNQRKPRPC